MADIGEAIYSRLVADATVFGLVGTRVLPSTPIDSVQRPYITYHLVSMFPRPRAMGSDPAVVTDIYQFDLWADKSEDGTKLDDAVMAALSGWHGTEAGVTVQVSFHRNRGISYESDTKCHRRSIEYEISWEE